MAKKKTRRPAAKKVSLGFPPEEHQKRAQNYERDAVTFLREVENEADAGRCEIAFDHLIDGVSYAGMAEAEAQGSGGKENVLPLKGLAASAIRYYRKNCGVGK
jgi:hypothetical protein